LSFLVFFRTLQDLEKAKTKTKQKMNKIKTEMQRTHNKLKLPFII